MKKLSVVPTRDPIDFIIGSSKTPLRYGYSKLYSRYFRLCFTYVWILDGIEKYVPLLGGGCCLNYFHFLRASKIQALDLKRSTLRSKRSVGICEFVCSYMILLC